MEKHKAKVALCAWVCACMRANYTKDSFLLASLYSFWCSLWQISVRGDFVCWFIWGQQCDINILYVFWVICFLWLFKEILTWECKMKWEEWFISSSWSISEIIKSFSYSWTVLKLTAERWNLTNTWNTTACSTVVFTRCSVWGRGARAYSSVARMFLVLWLC